jgi:hypothetical protein
VPWSFAATSTDEAQSWWRQRWGDAADERFSPTGDGRSSRRPAAAQQR